MSRPRVTLYDFVPYGAPELLEVRETYLTRALATASTGIVVLFAIAVAASGWLARQPVATLVPIAPGHQFERIPEFPPPPVPLAQPTAPHVSAAKHALPLPVPDRLAPPEQPVASKDDPGQTATGNVHENGGGDATNVPIAVEPVPGITDWVYYDEPPKVLTQVKPEYPDMAREAGVDGIVQLRVLVGKDGRVMDVHVDRSIPLLNEAAVAAARLWVFTPARSNGHAVMVWVAVPIRFTLHH